MQWRAPRGRRAARVQDSHRGQSTTNGRRDADRNLQSRPLHHAIIQQSRYDHSASCPPIEASASRATACSGTSCSIPKPANIRQSRPRIGMASCSLRRPASYINDKTTETPASGMAARIAASLSVAMSVTLRVVSVCVNGADAVPPAAKRSNCMASGSLRARPAVAPTARETNIRLVSSLQTQHTRFARSIHAECPTSGDN